MQASSSGKHGTADLLIALGLSIGAAVALGFSRFAYTLLLPPMQQDLGWSYSEAGSLNTANAAGYILGALTASWAARLFGQARAFSLGLGLSAIILLLTAATSNITILILLRTVGGVSTAFTFILGAALAGAVGSSEGPWRSGFLVSLYVAGASGGIVLSGIIVPLILQNEVHNWRMGWIALGAMAALGTLPAWVAARSVPDASKIVAAVPQTGRLSELRPILLGYGLFGAGYAGFMTFIIALLRSQGDGGQATAFWIVLGLVSTVSTLLWGLILNRFKEGRGPALVFAITMLGTTPVLVFPGMTAAFLSAFIFGGSVMAGPASITIVAKRHLAPTALTAGIAFLTASFALGQAFGPLLSGIVTDITGNIATGLWTSPIFLALGALASLLQRTRPTTIRPVL